VRIAHISDFHLRRHLPGTSTIPKRTSRQTPDLLQLALDQIRESKPDLIAVTGDLVDYPMYAMHDPEMIALGEKDLRMVRDLFADVGCPVAFVYGNHDHPASFRKVFADQLLDFDVDGTRILLFLDDEEDMHVPQRLGPERERLRAALLSEDPRPQIHLQHYVIAPQFNEGYPLSYAEATWMQEQLAADTRVRLALSGHWHTAGDPVVDGDTTFATVRAFGEPPHRWYIHDIGPDGVTSTEHQLLDGTELRRPAVFLDRDGNVNPQPAYRTGPEDMALVPGAAGALRRLREAGYVLVVVTNQTAVGAGFVTVETVGAVNDRMAQLLAAEGAAVDGVYCKYGMPNAIVPAFSSDTPGTKPDPAMLLQAAETLHLDLARSYMVGDQPSDLQAGVNAGCRQSILVRTGGGANVALSDIEPGVAVADITEAVDWILNHA
jgi:D,D-heptose 1,7-bisphosphate phosphatase